MKVDVWYESDTWVPLWTFDLPELKQRTYKWWPIASHNVYDEDFPQGHYDPPELNNARSDYVIPDLPF